MTSTILRSTAAAIAFAGGLALATPSMAAMTNFKASLTGPATAAHFHGPAPEGKNAGVMVPISPNGPAFEGSATLNDAQAKALVDGDMYVNIHTAANKGGEIRGQLTK